MLRASWLTGFTVAWLLVFGAVVANGDAAGGARLETIPHWRVFATHVPNLLSVDARSSSDVWAVGDGVVHWDGRTLHVAPPPWRNAVLTGVSVVSSSDVWAVGSISWGKYPHAREVPISARWNGRDWRRVQLPAISGEFVWLSDVVATGPRDVWAVGGWGGHRTWPLLLHFDGLRWERTNLQQVAPTLGQLNAIDARGSNDVWAAGMSGDWRMESYGYGDYVLHWDGRSWRLVASPLNDEATGPFSHAIDIGLTGEVWTLNFDLSGNGPYFVTWTGPARTAHVSDWMTYQSYDDIAAITPKDVWIVGQFNYDDAGKTHDTPLIGHWDGDRWHVQHTPFDHYTHVGLNAVSAVAANDIWAVGNHLIVRFSH